MRAGWCPVILAEGDCCKVKDIIVLSSCWRLFCSWCCSNLCWTLTRAPESRTWPHCKIWQNTCLSDPAQLIQCDSETVYTPPLLLQTAHSVCCFSGSLGQTVWPAESGQRRQSTWWCHPKTMALPQLFTCHHLWEHCADTVSGTTQFTQKLSQSLYTKNPKPTFFHSSNFNVSVLEWHLQTVHTHIYLYLCTLKMISVLYKDHLYLFYFFGFFYFNLVLLLSSRAAQPTVSVPCFTVHWP